MAEWLIENKRKLEFFMCAIARESASQHVNQRERVTVVKSEKPGVGVKTGTSKQVVT